LKPGLAVLPVTFSELSFYPRKNSGERGIKNKKSPSKKLEEPGNFRVDPFY
jgi:hypothetical protein